MKIRHPWVIRLAAFMASVLIRAWMATVRYRIVFLDGLPHPTDVRERRFLYSFWHESILFLTTFRAKAHVLISQHADGELIARACQHLGARVVRGSTTRGGVSALMHLVDISSRSHLVVTPDGPQGPRRRVQIGLIFLASRTGLPIVPAGIGWDSAWRARSWDRFALPVPFSAAYGVAGLPVHVPPGLNRRQLEQYRELVERRMLEVTAAAERWAAAGGRRPPRAGGGVAAAGAAAAA